MLLKRPNIKSPCVADRYHGPRERIAEITFPDGTGALLALCVLANGRKTITLYRADPGFDVSVCGKLIKTR